MKLEPVVFGMMQVHGDDKLQIKALALQIYYREFHDYTEKLFHSIGLNSIAEHLSSVKCWSM